MSVNPSKLRKMPTPICSVILAGGRGSRMGGQDKGLVHFAGRPLIEYTIDAVTPHSERIIISCNRNEGVYQEYSSFVVSDLDDSYQGPLAGLLAASALCAQDWVFCCPCDVPDLPTDIISLLLNGVDTQNHDIAVCHDGKRRQSLLMLVRAECLSSIATYLDEGGRRVDDWQNQLRTVELDCSEYADQLLNVNHQAELLP
ncbi:MAG: molybdenum cofactor guanylyltransferase MobA [Pseudomonadales bacterium]